MLDSLQYTTVFYAISAAPIQAPAICYVRAEVCMINLFKSQSLDLLD